jgi:hypothetical protein
MHNAPRRTRAALAALAATLATHASAQLPASPSFRAGGMDVTIGGRVQTQLSTSSVDSVALAAWALRRARIDLTTAMGAHVGGRLQLDFAGNRATVRDAYLRYTASPAFTVLAGNARRPFGLVSQTSSARMAPVERGVRIRGLPRARDEYALVSSLGYAERDLGVHVTGSPEGRLGVFYTAALTNGPVHRLDGGERSYQLTAQAGFRPVHALAVAASWGRRDFVQAPSDSAPAGSRGGRAWVLNAELGGDQRGVHALVEMAGGDEDPFAGRRFRGAQGWVSYRTGPLGAQISSLEPLFRISHGDPDARRRDAAEEGGTLVTPGFNVYLGGLNRVMLNLDVWRGADGAPSERSFKAQFQMAF